MNIKIKIEKNENSFEKELEDTAIQLTDCFSSDTGRYTSLEALSEKIVHTADNNELIYLNFILSQYKQKYSNKLSSQTIIAFISLGLSLITLGTNFMNEFVGMLLFLGGLYFLLMVAVIMWNEHFSVKNKKGSNVIFILEQAISRKQSSIQK